MLIITWIVFCQLLIGVQSNANYGNQPQPPPQQPHQPSPNNNYHPNYPLQPPIPQSEAQDPYKPYEYKPPMPCEPHNQLMEGNYYPTRPNEQQPQQQYSNQYYSTSSQPPLPSYPSQYFRDVSRQPQQQQQPGFFSKLKNSLISASSAIASSLDIQTNGPQYDAYDPRLSQTPPSGSYPANQTPRNYGNPPFHYPQNEEPFRGSVPPSSPRYEDNQPRSDGLFGKLKNIISPEEPQQPQLQPQHNMRPPYAGYPPNPSQIPGLMSAYPAELPPKKPEEIISPEAQVFIHENSIVMIAKPQEFHQKKTLFQQQGPQQLQVFSDFEHVITKFKQNKGQRALGSMELLESSGALSPAAVQQLQTLSDSIENKLNSTSTNEEQDLIFEDFIQQIQTIVCGQGNLHIYSIPMVVRKLIEHLSLRDGAKEFFQRLTLKGIPTFVLSSGYGDVITQALTFGETASTASTNHPSSSFVPPATLPSNMRVIANFFRAAPDGIVRAFSQPLLHERNKNITSIERVLGMPLPPRANALILGSHEDDVNMIKGMNGLQETLSIGFLELSEDFSQRIGVFLNAFDVVIIGDGNFHYAKHLIEDILGIAHTDASKDTLGSKLGLGLKKGLGFMFAGQETNTNNNNNMNNVNPSYPNPAINNLNNLNNNLNNNNYYASNYGSSTSTSSTLPSSASIANLSPYEYGEFTR